MKTSNSFVAHALSVPRRDSCRPLGQFGYPSFSNLQNTDDTNVGQASRDLVRQRPFPSFSHNPTAADPSPSAKERIKKGSCPKSVKPLEVFWDQSLPEFSWVRVPQIRDSSLVRRR